MTRTLYNSINKCWRIQKGQSKIDNPEKLVIQDTQDEGKQNKNTTQYLRDFIMTSLNGEFMST